MKKIPILLSTLTLAAGVNALTGPVISPLLGASVDSVAATDKNSDLLFGTNEFSIHGKTTKISPRRDMIELEMYEPLTGWYPKSVLIYHRDYESGVTEQEADAKIEQLGLGNESEWAVNILSKKAEAPGKLGITYTGATVKNGLIDNLTDQLYYAVEFGNYEMDGNNKKVWGSESLWVRGKVDYRDCVHSSAFDMGTMMCKSVDNGNEVYSFVPVVEADETAVEVPQNEKVISWEKEWRDEQLRRVREKKEQLEKLLEALSSAQELLEDATGVAKGADTAFEEVGDDERTEFSRQITSLYELIRAITGVYVGLEGQALVEENTTLTEKVAALTQENEALTGKVTDLTEENATLKTEKANLTQEKAVLIEEKQALKEEVEELKRQLSEANKVTEGSGPENDANMGEDVGVGMGANAGGNFENAGSNSENVAGTTTGATAPADKIEMVEVAQQITEVVSTGQVADNTGVASTEVNVTDTGENGENRETEQTQGALVVKDEENQTTDEDGLTVPDLGNREERKQGFWWLPVALIVALGGVIGVVAAKFRRR